MSITTRGRFIVFEGIDASGKSTQVNRLAEMVSAAGRKVHITAEPTTGPIGSLIRQAFSGRTPLDDRVIAALFVADRIDHLTNERDGILELLGRGIDVISDRYYLSSVAYHSSDIDMNWVVRANELSTDLLLPDLTIYLDVAPAVALRRLQSRAQQTDKFEVFERLSAAHNNYERAIELLGTRDNIQVISADGTLEEIAVEVQAVVNRSAGDVFQQAISTV
ncbi:dTMP kinase [Diaminobutyricibacter sp. McL0608]|uniref:dTMP kinase n=1 Tax=Leifsonia sp. McL0608 TaxID=3143537 RepID=UPI0031F30CC6